MNILLAPIYKDFAIIKAVAGVVLVSLFYVLDNSRWSTTPLSDFEVGICFYLSNDINYPPRIIDAAFPVAPLSIMPKNFEKHFFWRNFCRRVRTNEAYVVFNDNNLPQYYGHRADCVTAELVTAFEKGIVCFDVETQQFEKFVNANDL